MVESSPHKYNFLKLNKDELVNKLAHALSQSIPIVFWKHSPRFYEGRIVNSEYQNKKLTLILKFDFLPVSLNADEICINFAIKEVEYFVKTKVESQCDEEKILTMEVIEPSYRVEKRLQERIMAYPQYQCFLYLKYSKEDQKENVLFLNKKEAKEDKIFKLLSQKENIFSEDEGEELFGLRVEDINGDGLAGVCSQNEYEEIVSKFSNGKHTATLMFETRSFTIQELKLVYAIDYISPLFNSLKMKKLGFSFKHNVALKRELEDVTGVTLEMDDYRHEFEEFIKNE